jgi:hypothetical protein
MLNSLVLHHLSNLNIQLSYQCRKNGAINETKYSDLNSKKDTKLYNHLPFSNSMGFVAIVFP